MAVIWSFWNLKLWNSIEIVFKWHINCQESISRFYQHIKFILDIRPFSSAYVGDGCWKNNLRTIHTSELPTYLHTLPSLINVYTCLFFQPPFSTIHFLIRDYTFISFWQIKAWDFFMKELCHLFIGEKRQRSFRIVF